MVYTARINDIYTICKQNVDNLHYHKSWTTLPRIQSCFTGVMPLTGSVPLFKRQQYPETA